MTNLTNQQKSIYAILADSVYWDVRKENNEGSQDKPDRSKSNWTLIPSDWKLIKEESGSGQQGRADNPHLQGFTARAYQNMTTNEIVIAYAGTEDITGIDGKIDVELAAGISSVQANYAALFYHEVKHKYPDADISFTGHSLGGGLAGLMGIYFDKAA